jgi:hypothetical protein
MTNQSKLKKLFRAHAVATGVNYTRARKEVLDLLKDDPEAYHRLRTTYNLDYVWTAPKQNKKKEQ